MLGWIKVTFTKAIQCLGKKEIGWGFRVMAEHLSHRLSNLRIETESSGAVNLLKFSKDSSRVLQSLGTEKQSLELRQVIFPYALYIDVFTGYMFQILVFIGKQGETISLNVYDHDSQ